MFLLENNHDFQSFGDTFGIRAITKKPRSLSSQAMASTSNESMYCFLAVARKAGIPSVCGRQVCGWLVSTNTYVFQLARKIAEEWKEDWRNHCDWTVVGSRGDSEFKTSIFFSYESKLYHTFNDVATWGRWQKTDATSIIGNYDLTQETIRRMYDFFKYYSKREGAYEIEYYLDYRSTMPFAAFLAGAAWNGEIFFKDNPLESRSGLGHFVIMGILASENEKPLDLPGWAHKDDDLLWDLFEYLLHPRMADLLAKFEEMLDLSRTNLFFATRFLTKCVQDKRYTKQLQWRTRMNHGLLMKVLQILIVHEVGYSVIMKYECMVALHTQKEQFRIAFAQAVRKRRYTA